MLDKALRNILRINVTQARKLLEDAIREQLQGQFGIHSNGMIEPTTAMGHLLEEDQRYRAQIITYLEHVQVSGFGMRDAITQLIREVAFTHLNRLCAYKMMETRGLIREAVSRGLKSKGFLFYLSDHPEDERLWSSGKQDRAYRHFIEWTNEKLSAEIGVLFSSTDPANRLFPVQRVLDEVLALINSEELSTIWSEDEVIGWIYQYFTPKELRDKARKESRSPRSSYELAFRNQFYTPRYVVHFLTDNTLGRIWYEMQQGKTQLKELCSYLVRRPDEVFFAEPYSEAIKQAQQWLQGERVPEPDASALAHTVNGYMRLEAFSAEANEWVNERLAEVMTEQVTTLKTQELLDVLFYIHRMERFVEGTLEGLQAEIAAIIAELRTRVVAQSNDNRSQEELLRAPFFIPYRASKDPREIKILDPACGSGHFLLYCFDLLTTIYLEAYEVAEPEDVLKRDYPTLAALQYAMPGLILARNLHGIDIDLRATQIASLALWLRAQRAYKDMQIPSAERPQIRKSKVVCAEPMPGEKDMLKEFTSTLQPEMLGKLVQTVFEKMKLASEAGSLLKIEVEIKEAVLEVKKLWLCQPEAKQLELWSEPKKGVMQQKLAETEITDLAFWNEAEEKVIEALRAYATSVSNDRGFARQLFVDDAVQGFAFIDLCQKQFDVVLMNPPFGAASQTSNTYIDQSYPSTKGDLLANFIERALDFCLPNGTVGAISSRTCFFLGAFTSFREEILRKKGHVSYMADLGEGVLEAMVETAAYVLTRRDKFQAHSLFFRSLLDVNKAHALQVSINDILAKILNKNTFLVNTDEFSRLLTSPYAYWVTNDIIFILIKEKQLEGNFGVVRVGLQTSDDTRFLRLVWEVPPSKIGILTESNISSFVDSMHSSFKKDKRWAFYSKTDTASLWVSPPTLVVDWNRDGEDLKQFIRDRGDSPSRSVRSENLYFKPGFSYMSRSTRLVPYIVPAGVIPMAVRSQVYPISNNEFSLLGYCASNIASAVARFSGGMFARPMFQAGMIQNLPLPNFDSQTVKRLSEQINSEVNKRRLIIQGYEPYQEFTLPAFLSNVKSSSNGWNPHSLLGNELEREIARAFGFSNAQLEILERDIQEAIAIRDISTHEFHISEAEDDQSSNIELIDENREVKAKGFISYCMGCIFGRWDVRLALNKQLIPKLQGIFDPLPVCPPGTLVGPDGLPATSGNIVSEKWLSSRPNVITLPEEDSVRQSTIGDTEYALNIDWNGILVDDPYHSSDIMTNVQKVLTIILRERAERIEQEICQEIKVKDLRDYFRRPSKGGFWYDHIQQYSKSRRKAPIYWLLQSSKKNYAIWLYYHRLTKDTLFKVLSNYVEPKIRREEAQLEQLRSQLQATGSVGREAKTLERQLERQEHLISELEDFRDKLRRVADLNLEPDLNDGVVLNIAPLWELVPWSEARKYWEELCAGKYEWSAISKQLREKGLV